ncbi:tetraacyldisaccharide 4'-kinase [Algoriphagus hitonicola]|uniref:Tetraacyldisaccharide 4'-kinase n=1 Tax=Algoriphagus hitonicola TaxID=435880 RepID=A0A1I2PEN9_9BACT|nr:tetraacyldisaccharide 4'-kinase [Algoriphagus hitonicola]SFG13599.1 lipid-A-disaccharide kinase [Algoriphagus hitonicola]
MHRLAFILFPFALIFDLITRIRNYLYDRGYLKSQLSAIPAILVGNLRVGGTGKTPMVEYLIRQYHSSYRTATLSRGYGRKTKGFIKAGKVSFPEGIGDEPYQIYQKFGNKLQVFVGEDRRAAIEQIMDEVQPPELLLLDDAFQHRSVKTHLNILLTTYQAPFYEDFLLPMGRLRESRSGANRADVIIVSKCPSRISEEEKNTIKRKIGSYIYLGQPILFSCIGYGKPETWGRKAEFSGQVVLMTGIAQVDALESFVKANYTLLESMRLDDHHQYKESDFEKLGLVLAKHARANPVVLTTEKDAVKVKSFYPEGFIREIPIFVIPIQVEFSTEDAKTLNQIIQQKVLKKDHFGE